MSTITDYTDLLGAWYATRGSQGQSAASFSAATSAAKAQDKIVPPWDPRTEQPTPDQRLKSALGGQPFIDEGAAKLTDANASESDQKLFALYNGLAKLAAIVNNAADKTTPETMLGTLNKRFQAGLDEILTYAKSVQTGDLAVVAGQKASKLDASIFVPRGLSQYTTRILQRTPTTDAMPGLDGTEKFTIAVTKGNVTTNVDIDLSEMGTSDIKLDDLITFLNGKLHDAGMVTKFKKIRLDLLDADGKAKSPPPQNWGLSIQGTSTERLSFSAPDAGTAVYLAGNSGKSGATAGQLLKLDASGATPTLMTSARIEADAIEGGSTSSSDTTTNTVKTDNADPAVAAAVAGLNKILAGTTTASTTQPPANPATTAAASTIDADGNSYVVGTTTGDMNGEVLQGDKDVFLTKYDSTGHVVWQRMIGDSGSTEGAAVAVDASGNVVIAGKTTGDLNGGTNSGHSNSFVTKFDRSGQEQWTRNIGPIADDSASAVTIASDGSVYFGGQTKGALAAGITSGGGEDGFITKLTGAGKFVYNRQFGGAGDENVAAMSTDSDGNLVVLSNESGHAVVRKYDPSNATAPALWGQDLGDLGGGQASAIAIDGTTIHVGGWTQNGGVGGGTVQGSYQGGIDGFVISLDGAGAIDTTTYVGTGATDRVRSLTVNNGDVYIAGDTTGDLGGGFKGSVNGFAAKLNSSGALDWVYQYAGRNGEARTYGIAVDDQGSSVLDVLGLPKGRLDYSQARTVIAQSTVRPGQEFFVAVNGGTKRRIVIDAKDTLNSLSQKINRVLVLDGKASVHTVSGGSNLRIQGAQGARIDLIAGPEGHDALKGLGLSEGTIVADPPVGDGADTSSQSNSSTDSTAKQPLYVGLGLASDLSISSHASAGQVNGLVQSALTSLRKAFRDLNPDPALAALSKLPNAGGPVPQYLQTQLANYQSGLARLTGGSIA